MLPNTDEARKYKLTRTVFLLTRVFTQHFHYISLTSGQFPDICPTDVNWSPCSVSSHPLYCKYITVPVRHSWNKTCITTIIQVKWERIRLTKQSVPCHQLAYSIKLYYGVTVPCILKDDCENTTQSNTLWRRQTGFFLAFCMLQLRWIKSSDLWFNIHWQMLRTFTHLVICKMKCQSL